MTIKERILSIFLTIILSVFCFIPLFEFKTYAEEIPQSLYRVYLNGRCIGLIESKDKLEQYINEEQTELKEEYGVDKVYLPKGLYISEYDTYDTNITSEEDIYQLIKETENFTIKGYIITISTDEEEITFNVLNEEDFANSVTSVVKAFVDDDELNQYTSGEDVEIDGVGEKIEDLYISENITIQEAYIPSDEIIYMDENEITKYLLFGSEDTEETYTVRTGDTISSIANDNKLAVDEFLVVNPDLKSENSLLSIGQEVSVALVSPVIKIIVEKHVVEEQTIKYTTQVKYDSNMTSGVTEITQAGQDGLEMVTQKIQYENGKITEAVITKTEVIKEAIDKIKVVGTKGNSRVDLSDMPALSDWYWPTLTPYIISSPYGWRWGTLHEGVDITGTGYGSPIYAANNGIVYKVYYDSTGGYQIVIAHAEGYYTIYAHLSKQLVSVGQIVTRGQKIALMGSTGYSTGTHLHFGTYIGVPYGGGYSFNPMTLYR